MRKFFLKQLFTFLNFMFSLPERYQQIVILILKFAAYMSRKITLKYIFIFFLWHLKDIFIILTAMNTLIFLILSFAVFAVSNARMPAELSKILGMEQENTKRPTTRLQEDLRKDPGTFLGKEFDLNRYLSQSASIEDARRKLGAGDVEEYISPPVQKVECHVEFQVTERVPGRCTKLAGNIPACQSPQYIGINFSECS